MAASLMPLFALFRAGGFALKGGYKRLKIMEGLRQVRTWTGNWTASHVAHLAVRKLWTIALT